MSREIIAESSTTTSAHKADRGSSSVANRSASGSSAGRALRISAAQLIGRRAHIVFVTTYDRYAVQTLEHGALDYLVKPLEAVRVAATMLRLRERLDAGPSATDSDALLERLLERLHPADQPQALRWLRASVGSTLRLIAVDDIDYLRSEENTRGSPGATKPATPAMH